MTESFHFKNRFLIDYIKTNRHRVNNATICTFVELTNYCKVEMTLQQMLFRNNVDWSLKKHTCRILMTNGDLFYVDKHILLFDTLKVKQTLENTRKMYPDIFSKVVKAFLNSPFLFLNVIDDTVEDESIDKNASESEDNETDDE